MISLLLFVVLATFSVQAVEVSIRYAPPVLGFTLPLNNRGIGGVVFNYAINDKTFKARGVKTSEGWQFLTRDVNLDGGDTVYANAVVYDVNGNMRMSTPRSSLTLGDSPLVAQLPSRRIRGAVIWRDDFSSMFLDKSKWKYEVSMYGGYNGEFQVYTNDQKNVYTKNGLLYIDPGLTTYDSRFNDNSLYHGSMDMKSLYGYCTISSVRGCHRDGKDGLLPPVTSGKIMSVPALKYGIVEVRAKIPLGDWLWPAIWMKPVNGRYGTWPRSGEVDLMESRGNKGSYGVGRVKSTLHWGPDSHHNMHRLTEGSKFSTSYHDAFHVYKMVWSPDHIITYVDDQVIMNVPAPNGGFWKKGGFSGHNIWESGNDIAPYDQEFYLILNVAVGGTSGWFTDGATYGGSKKPWSNSSPKALEEFWNDRNHWLPTWHKGAKEMKIDYVEFRHI